MQSGNSWATNSQPRSLASHSNPGSALLPVNWPNQPGTNAVPSPPPSQLDYPRPSPVSASLAHLDMTLHHHIDTVFGALSRLTTDKHDRVLDGVLTRLDNLEDVMRKGFKDLRSEIKQVKGDVSRIKSHKDGQEQNQDAIYAHLERINDKLGSLEISGEGQFRQQIQRPEVRTHNQAEGNGSNQQPERQEERGPSTEHRGPRGQSRPPVSTRTAGNRSQRSYTSVSQPDFGHGDELTARKAFLAELNGSRGMPEGRDHQSVGGLQDSSQSESEPSKLSEGSSGDSARFANGAWYHLAYGRKGL